MLRFKKQKIRAKILFFILLIFIIGCTKQIKEIPKKVEQSSKESTKVIEEPEIETIKKNGQGDC